MLLTKRALILILFSIVTIGCGGGGGGGSDAPAAEVVVDDGGTDTGDSSETVDTGGTGVVGETSLAGIDLPDQMDVVTATDGNTNVSNIGSQPKRLDRSITSTLRLPTLFSDLGTDYVTDRQFTHVWLPALEPIEQVNGILCFTGQLRADELVNQGAYTALVDEDECFEKGGDNSSGSGGQNAAADNAPNYTEVVAMSTRATADAPMIVSVWIPRDEGGESQGDEGGEGNQGGEAIKVKVIVTEAPTESNPFGDFSLNFTMLEAIDSTETFGAGELKTVDAADGFFGFTMYDSSEGTGYSRTQTASVVMNSDQTAGNALTSASNTESFGDQERSFGGAYAIAFNDDNVLLEEGEEYGDLSIEGSGVDATATCLSRDSFDEKVWRYNLYDADTGDRVDQSSGFPFRYDSDNDGEVDSYGHASYWGIWTEGDATFTSGDTLTRDNFGGPGEQEAEAETYTVTAAPGRLIKHTVESIALTDVVGTDFNLWDDSVPQGSDSWLVNYRAATDNDAAGFYKVGTLSFGNNGRSVTELETPLLITLTTDERLFLFSDQLGGGVQYVSGAASLTFFAEEFVNGSETGTGGLFAGGDVTFACFHDCPVGNISVQDVSTFIGPYLDPQGSGGPGDPSNQQGPCGGPGEDPCPVQPSEITPVTYTFSASDLTLTRVGTSAGPVKYNFTRSELPSDSPFGYGVRSGPLVLESDAATLDVNDLHDPSKVTVFYAWQTSLESWDQQVVLRDGDGNLVTFDKPIQFSYQHATANDRNAPTSGDVAGNGETFFLEYFGAGELHGIPWVGEEAAEDLDQEDQEDQDQRFYPAFNLADGVVMGPNDEYVVKATDLEQKMASVAVGNCSALTLTTPSAPVPTSATGVVDIGDMPVVTGSPSVVAGELQGATDS